MDLELKIKNFGPIDEATIQVGRFTVFAGPNSTGKTFVSKMLYSMLRARDANYARELVSILKGSIEGGLLDQAGEERSLYVIRQGVQKIASIVQEASSNYPSKNEMDLLEEIHPRLMVEIEKIKAHVQPLKNNIKRKELGPLFDASINLLEKSIDLLERSLSDMASLINSGRFLSVQRNFQLSSLSSLKGEGDSLLHFNVEEVGELREVEGNFEFNLNPHMQLISEIFYLESPIYWKLKSALESIRLDSRSSFNTALNGVPDYFYDVVVALRRGRVEHPLHTGRLHENLHDVIGGKISLSEAGDLEFYEKGKSIPLSLTSAGVANMGMLALLIERGALDQGSLLFIDEPESNLHPAWQVEMVALLFELARQGVNVVISTHSMTILKWLEVHIKEKPEDRELVKLNKFPPDAEWNDDMDAVMAEVKQSLTKPFSDLYIRGL